MGLQKPRSPLQEQGVSRIVAVDMESAVGMVEAA